MKFSFKTFLEFDEPWQRAVKRQYGAEDNTNPPQLVLNTAKFMSNGKPKTILSGTMLQKITPNRENQDDTDPKKSFVTVKIMNQADPRDPLMSDKGHGQPSQYAGETFTIPMNVYNWMIQPGQSPQAQPPQAPMGQDQAPGGNMPPPSAGGASPQV